eukprot:scaffold246473_cov31-Tisochrysis_lutea.AAC.3
MIRAYTTATSRWRRKKKPWKISLPPQKRTGWRGRKMMRRANQFVRADTTQPNAGMVKTATSRCGHLHQRPSWIRPKNPPISAPLLRMKASSGRPISIMASTAICLSCVSTSKTVDRISKSVGSSSASARKSAKTRETI